MSNSKFISDTFKYVKRPSANQVLKRSDHDSNDKDCKFSFDRCLCSIKSQCVINMSEHTCTCTVAFSDSPGNYDPMCLVRYSTGNV